MIANVILNFIGPERAVLLNVDSFRIPSDMINSSLANASVEICSDGLENLVKSCAPQFHSLMVLLSTPRIVFATVATTGTGKTTVVSKTSV
jgi:flagellar biosynthesis GTPase FlhF